MDIPFNEGNPPPPTPVDDDGLTVVETTDLGRETPSPTDEDSEPADVPTATSELQTATPEATPSIPFDAQESVIGFGSNLREGPGTSFAINQYLNPGEQVYILGRDIPGLWVYVRTAAPIDGEIFEGWLAIQQFEIIPDVTDLEYGPGIVHPEQTEAP